MLLNPKKDMVGVQPLQGSVDAMDPFDHPVPGQSLTDAP